MSELKQYEYVEINELVSVSNWYILEENAAGSRNKVIVENPERTDEFHIFKEPKPQREAQIWSEFIASYIAGDLLSWPVQHCAIAIRDGRIGNLLKYIYQPDKDSFIPGELMCKHLDPKFDPKLGRRHRWSLVKEISGISFAAGDEESDAKPIDYNEYFQFWARAIAFDAFISNTDRHAENWAILYSSSKGPRLAPLYDNATSMGCEIDEDTLQKTWFDESGKLIQTKLDKYVSNGCHHLRRQETRFGFSELVSLVLEEFPEMRPEFESIAGLDVNKIESFLNECMALADVPEVAKLTQARAKQISALLNAGQKRIISCLGK